MAIYRYLVTVETDDTNGLIDGQLIAEELDANLESCILDYGLAHFTVEACDLVPRDTLPGSVYDYRERVIRSHEQ